MSKVKKGCVVLNISLYTDGDYWIEGDDCKRLKIFQNPDNHRQYECKLFLGSDGQYKLEIYLQKLVTSFRVNYNHYYLIKRLYSMVDEIIKRVHTSDKHDHLLISSLDGNYEGTPITVEFTDEFTFAAMKKQYEEYVTCTECSHSIPRSQTTSETRYCERCGKLLPFYWRYEDGRN